MYPALAVLQAVEQLRETEYSEEVDVMWIGSASGMEGDLVEREGILFRSIPSGGLHGVGMKSMPRNAWKVFQGFMKSRKILRDFQPDVMFFTGGHVAFPVALAGHSVPKLVFVPDIEPGMALKSLIRMTDHVVVNVEQSREYIPSKKRVTVTGYPTRLSLRHWDKSRALEVFGLDSTLPVLLVFGGSLGARSINLALLSVLEDILQEMQVIHISGKRDWNDVAAFQQTLSDDLKKRYKAFDYLHEEMGAALAAADLVLSRGGASCLGEYPLFGLPAIIVPYPYAWRYQKTNAEFLAKKGAAVIILDEDLKKELKEVVFSLMRDAGKRETMSRAMLSLSKRDAAVEIARILFEMAGATEKKEAKHD